MNASRALRFALSVVALGLLGSTAACSTDAEEPGDAEAGEEDLTSITARSRTLEFVGTVYVAPNADDASIMQTVRTQAQTAFGPLRTSDIAVNSRELREVDAATFVKRPVKVIDTNVANDPGKDMLEVKYTYKDNAVVDVRYARRTVVPLALMSPSYRSQIDRMLQECTPNDEHAREFSSSAWYIFEPRLPQCQEAMQAEQKKITSDRQKLKDKTKQVTKSDLDRLYLPISARLGADKTNKGTSYPDYQRLYAGGIARDKLIISLVYGNIDHDRKNGPSGDYNWGELMTTLSEVMDAGGELTVVKSEADLSSFTLASGKKVNAPSFKNLVSLHGGRDGLGLSYADRSDLEKQFATRIDKKWVTAERHVKVSAPGQAERDVAVQFLVYFGADSDARPHKHATKNSDIFLYNGHSSIGYGPLDPRNFTKSDFAQTYQILWIDGCVSYNYYEKDYIPLKDNGTKDLDLITNGLEAPAWRSGHAMGQFLNVLLNGKGASYRDLLQAARDTEALRVVDGELDNTYTPARFPMTITPR